MTEDLHQTELWRIDLRSGLSTKVPTPTGWPRLFTPNGWTVTGGPSAVLHGGGPDVPLPDVEGHVREARGILGVSDLRVLSWDGRIVAGYQSVPATDPGATMADIVAVIWRCG